MQRRIAVAVALMLDPSLLLRPWTVDDVRDGLPAAVSATFLDLARRRALPNAVFSSFGPRGVDRREVAELAHEVAESDGFEPHRAGPEEALPVEVRDPAVRAILLDEWSFLQDSGVWLASRIRRPFSAFVRGGVAAVEVPGEALDRWPGLPAALAPDRGLRRATSWLALGGGAALLDALATGIPTHVAGAFVLFDV